MKLLCSALLVAALAACGGTKNPPTISDLTLSSTSVSPGGQLTLQVKVSDPDGLADLKIAYRLSGPVTQPEQVLTVPGASNSLKDAQVPITLTMVSTAPAGDYTVTVAAIDGSGTRSGELSATFTVK